MATKENTFFGTVVNSIKNIEKYPEMATRPFTQIIKYFIILMLIFTLVATISSIYSVSKDINECIDYIKNDLPKFEYSNKELKFEAENELKINPKRYIDLIIINTKNITNEQIDNYKDEISKYNIGAILLKDKIVIHMNNQYIDYSYENIQNTFNIDKLDKEILLDYLSGGNLFKIYVIIFILTFISLYISYTLSIAIDIICFGLAGFVTALVLRIRLKLKAVFKIATYALTLPVILNLIYIIEQSIFGYEIKYFEIMYIAVTYIYVVSAILMIKSDLIKRGLELTRIIEEEQKVKEEMKNEDQKEKEKEKDKDKEKEEDKETKEKEEKNEEKLKDDEQKEQKDNNDKKDDDKSKDEPQGENA